VISTVLALVAALAPATAREPARTVPRPAITRRFIPLTARRRRDTAAYARRHYGRATTEIQRPRAIVVHYTVNDSVGATWSTFAPNAPDPELHERPGTCTQFVVARNGRIVQLTPVTFLCRHTVGLNWAAIGIEHVGYSEREVLGNRAQLRASLRLVRWLRCRYGIRAADVIGHAESVGSRWHRERVVALRTQTHGDWRLWAMRRYRADVRRAGC
jgi:N-acetylmuramoyl-L-alanine amidase